MTDHEQPAAGVADYRNFPGHSMCCRCVSCENANRNRDLWFPGDPPRAPTDAGGAVSESGYLDAFYDLAKIMGIGARAWSPKRVWETEMRPRILAALTTSPYALGGGAVGNAALELREQIEAADGLGTVTIQQWAARQILATLTPAPQAEGEGLPAISLDGPHKPGNIRRWLARQLLDSRLDDEEAFGIVADHPSISDITAPQPLQQGGEITRADLGDLAGLVERIEQGGTSCCGSDGGEGYRLGQEAARAIRSLAADRDKAVGLLRAAASHLPTTGPLGDRINAFLSSQTEGR